MSSTPEVRRRRRRKMLPRTNEVGCLVAYSFNHISLSLVCLSVCLSVCPSVFLSIYISIGCRVYLSHVYPNALLYSSLTIYLSIGRLINAYFIQSFCLSFAAVLYMNSTYVAGNYVALILISLCFGCF